jgi:hypothetical protein
MSDEKDEAKAEAAREEALVRRAHARSRKPALAFMLGVLVIGLIGAAVYLLWPEPAQTPATPTEAVITDEAKGLPAPDGRAISAQVDAALRATPATQNQAALEAAQAAFRETAPEPEDTARAGAPAPAPRTPTAATPPR